MVAPKKILLAFGLIFLNLVACKSEPNKLGDEPEKPGPIAEPDTPPAQPLVSIEITGENLGMMSPGSTKIAYVDVKNAGTVEIQNLALALPPAPFSIEGGVFPGTTGTCSASLLAPGDSCKIAIAVTAAVPPGISRNSVMFSYDAEGKPYSQQVDLQVEITGPVKLKAEDINFGSVDVGTSKTIKLSLTNLHATEDIQNLTLQQAANSAFRIDNPSLCKTIGHNSTCELDVIFTPKGKVNLSEQLSISFEASGSKQTETIRITAEGRAAGLASIEITGNEFGKIIPGSSKVTYLKIKNASTVEIKNLTLSSLSAPFSLEGGVFPGTTGTCSASALAPGAECKIAIVIAATGAPGVSSKSVTLGYQVAGQPSDLKFDLQAEFVGAVKLLAGSINFGIVDVGASKTLKVSLTNPASQEDIQNLTVQPAVNSKFYISNPALCKTIFRNSKCELDVVFTPTSKGNISEDVKVTYEVQGRRETEVIKITAEGRDVGIVKVEITGNDVGKVSLGSTKIAYLDITNTGTVEIKNLTLANSDPFFVEGGVFPGKTGNCSAGSLAPGASCNVAIAAVAPLTPAISIKSMAFGYDADGKTYSQNVALRAEFEDVVRLNVNSISFGTVPVGTSKTMKLSLNNSGLQGEIQALSVWEGVNSAFEIKNRNACSTIRPNSTCELDVEFTPTRQMNILEKFKITYVAQGFQTEFVNIAAVGQDIEYVTARILSPINQVAGYGKDGEIEIGLTVPSAGPLSSTVVDHFDIEPSSLLAADLYRNYPSSTCEFSTELKGSGGRTTCKFVLKAREIKSDTAFNQNININYRAGGLADKVLTLSLNNKFSIKLPELDASSKHQFGTLNLVQGASAPITIVVNNPIDGSIKDVIISGFLGSLPTPLALDRGASTCIAKGTLGRGETCTFVILASPTANSDNFSAALNIKHLAGGDILTLPVTLAGKFVVTPKQVKGAQGVPFLAIAGGNFGIIPDVRPGVPFEVKLTVTNNGAGGAAMASAISLDRYDPKGNSLVEWGDDYFIKVVQDPGKSTCKAANLNLAKDKSCDLVLAIKPVKGQPKKVGNRKFLISYTDDGGNKHQQDFSVSGFWTFFDRVVSADMKAVPTIETVKSGDPWFEYSKREIFQGVGKGYYTQSDWDKTLGETATKPKKKFMSWTFPVASPTSKTLLADIVPDRIVEKGVRYIKMYHGSTSDVINAFTAGSKGIFFEAATTVALGVGFYLSASPNESKNYACDRRSKKPADVQPILLVVGIREDAQISGREAQGVLLSHPDGSPKENGIFFKRNSGMYNQFVFFDNVQPYLRIIKILKLESGFGMADSYDDYNGKATNDTGPDKNNSYKCIY